MIATPVSDYAAAVRAALDDIPADDRAELLEDLEDHLAEIAEDSGVPLEDRLGPPERYAAELRAAYTDAAPVAPRLSLARLLDRFEQALSDLAERDLPGHDLLRRALRDLRPAWWVLRGYGLAYLALSLGQGGDPGPFGSGTGGPALIVLAAAASYWLGDRDRDRSGAGRPRKARSALTFAVNAIGLWGVLVFAATLDDGGGDVSTSYPSYPEERPVGGFINLYPYKDGKPLIDVQLYDANGQPFEMGQQEEPYMQMPGSAPVAPNTYPKPMCFSDPDQIYLGEAPRLVPTCPAAPSVGPPGSGAPASSAPTPSKTPGVVSPGPAASKRS